MLRVGALFLYCSSSPYSADEHAGVVARVWIKSRIEEDTDTSEGESDLDAGSLDAIQMRVNIVVSWLFKTSTLQGAPDLSARYPHIFVLLAEASVCFLLIQHARTLCDPCILGLPIPNSLFFLPQKNKKHLNRRKRIHLYGWRETLAESQLGQLLYSLLAVQLDKLQIFWSPGMLPLPRQS